MPSNCELVPAVALPSSVRGADWPSVMVYVPPALAVGPTNTGAKLKFV